MKTNKQRNHKKNIANNPPIISKIGYNTNCEIIWKEVYIKDKLKSFESFQYKNQQLSQIDCFCDNDLIMVYKFHPNGNIAEVRGVRRGRKHGILNRFDKNTNITSSRNYINGERDGVQKTFESGTGALARKAVYSNGTLIDETVYIKPQFERITNTEQVLKNTVSQKMAISKIK